MHLRSPLSTRFLFVHATALVMTIVAGCGGDDPPSSTALGGASGDGGAGGASGTSAGSSGTAGISGSNGTSGAAGTTITGGAAGTGGTAGSTSGTAGSTSGTAGASATGGTSGSGGTAGSTSGTAGAGGTSGIGGTSGTAGTGGTSGTSGTSGVAGTGGTGATGGTGGTAGGASGTGGAAGLAGTAGVSGTGGTAGLAGTAGIAGTAGTAGTTSSCTIPTDCPGADTECSVRTCVAQQCGVSNTASGTVVSAGSQILGDCKVVTCDGNGSTHSVVDDTDKPDDQNPCTSNQCSNGTPSNPALAAGVSCGASLVCDGLGHCQGCVADTDCPVGDACNLRHCSGGTCGFTHPAPGTAVDGGTAADCQKRVCGVNGAIVSTADDSDHPVDDGNQCTTDTCSAGAPVHPAAAQGVMCTQNGGAVCSGAGSCVQCNTVADCGGTACSNGVCQAASCTDGLHNGQESGVDCGGSTCPACANSGACQVMADCLSGICLGNACQAVTVVSTTPADGATGVLVSSTIAVTFSAAVTPASITVQSTPGACSGSVQVSTDDFATCIGLSAPTMTVSNTVVTVTPAPALSYGSTYKVRVTTAVKDAGNQAIGAQYTSATGVSTGAPPACSSTGSVVISQVYGGGGNSGATYKNDFIELHNNSSTTVSLMGWSVQYAGASATSSWTVTALTGSIAPGGYYLVQEAQGSGGTTALPTPDATGTLSLGSTAGKVALVNSTMALPASTCPYGASVQDLVGFGAASCSETAATPVLSNTTAAVRNGAGTIDTNNNGADFTVTAPTPRNSSTTPIPSSCTLNESGLTSEINYCVVQFPTSLSVQAGMVSTPVYGRDYEPGVTGLANGAHGTYVAQLGYGPRTVNPENQSGWVWTAATYNAGYMDPSNDEYQASLTAPATAGSYAYTYRFSPDGISWTYCDSNGAGSNTNPDFTFEVTQLPILTVTP